MALLASLSMFASIILACKYLTTRVMLNTLIDGERFGSYIPKFTGKPPILVVAVSSRRAVSCEFLETERC